jgi:prepilin-type N-terminal cleavage/methylation domain-containing protein
MSRPSHAGFSLVECLIATALLASAIPALGHLIAVAVGTAATARHATVAALLAQRKLEELRTMPFANLEGLCRPDAPCSDYLDARGVVVGGGGSPPRGTAYIRWWSAANIRGDLWIIEAAAARWRTGWPSAAGATAPETTRLHSARTAGMP